MWYPNYESLSPKYAHAVFSDAQHPDVRIRYPSEPDVRTEANNYYLVRETASKWEETR